MTQEISLEASRSTKWNEVRAWVETVVHPYPRYGLAVAVTFYAQDKPVSKLTDGDLREALAQAIEGGLEHFRIEAATDPLPPQTRVQFKAISLGRLQSDSNLVQKAGLPEKGIYLFPSIITADASARKTFDESSRLAKDLRNRDIPITQINKLKRSFAPVVGELNNGRPEKVEQTASLFEAACAAVASLTPEKPSAWARALNKSPVSDAKSKKSGSPVNTAIIPDLPFDDLCEFVRVFHQLQAQGGDLLHGKKTNDDKYRRPQLHAGNYPDALAEPALSAVGLLAAIGYWADHADETTRIKTLGVLESLADRPLYVVSYDNVWQARFSHHIVDLAKTGKLRAMLTDIRNSALLYPGMGYGKPVRFPPNKSASDYKELQSLFLAYQHFTLTFGRFLERFDLPALRELLAVRVEYPSSMKLLWEAYFMDSKCGLVPRPVVESARSLGRWMNRTAYFAADSEVAPFKPSERSALSDEQRAAREADVRKEKARKLVQFESYVMSAKTSTDMLHRVTETTGRLSEQDAPEDAEIFVTAVAAGEVPLKTAQQLLLAYMRLRAGGTGKVTEDSLGGLQAAAAGDDDDSDLEE